VALQPVHHPFRAALPGPAPVKHADVPVLRPRQQVLVVRREARADVEPLVVLVADDEALQLQVKRLEDERQARSRRGQQLGPVGAEGELRPGSQRELLGRLFVCGSIVVCGRWWVRWRSGDSLINQSSYPLLMGWRAVHGSPSQPNPTQPNLQPQLDWPRCRGAAPW
jgi:hypothetical protein